MDYQINRKKFAVGTSAFGPTLLNFGRNYFGARDAFVYVYSHDNDSAYKPSDRMVLARVPLTSIRNREAYEFFAGLDDSANPQWTPSIAKRSAVFLNAGNCYRTGIETRVRARPMTQRTSGLFVLMACLWFQPVLVAQNRSAAETDVAPVAPDFARDIRPLLKVRCNKCHGEEKQQGGLRLDTKAAALKGGDSDRPSFVAGKPDESLVVELVTSQDIDQRMPLKAEPLTATEVELLKRWIHAGAQWPESESAKSAQSQMVVSDEDRQHWSFRPLQQITPPLIEEVASVRTPVDQFIRSTLAEHKLSPSQEADRRTLIRRIYFDLIGLPPKPEEVEAFVNSSDSNAYEKLIEKLLTSDHYGERWARHWLDVARYADSDGQEGDADRPNAYHFRDFVIHALNDDMPYNELVRWQLAGDEIDPDNPRAIAATGFIVAGTSTILNVPMEEEKLRNRANELDDMVSTTGQALLGLTLACARCHDHKYDPLPTRDYYRMMRIFNSGDRTEVPLVARAELATHRQATASWQKEFDEAKKQRDDWLKEARKPFIDSIRAEKIAKLSATEDEKKLLLETPDVANAKKLANRFNKELKVGDAEYVAAMPEEKQALWKEHDRQVREIEARKPATLPTAFAFADFAPEPRESWYFERGDFMARNERMDLGFLTVLTTGKTPDDYWSEARQSQQRDDSTQQRRAMADWITDLDHGAGVLLARVIVNRVWQHHFKEGLVKTASDFGTRGDLPTHPELLEWLTSEFIHHGWSLKHLHRLMLNSATYRQSNTSNADNAAVDPSNHWLWQRRPMRLESEVLRDSILAVSDSLNPAMYGPSFKPPIAVEAMQARNVKNAYPRDAKDSAETRRRSIYMFHKRVVQYPFMQAFDAPDAQVSCGRRVNTTVAPQALALLNDPFVRLRAAELAQRLQLEFSSEQTKQVQRAFELCLARQPEADELEDAIAFLRSQQEARSQRDSNLSAEQASQLALTDICQMMFSLNEFIYID